MSWNISFAALTACILGILLVFYFTRPRFQIHLNIVFFHLLVFQVLTLFIDIISSYLDSNYEHWPFALLYVANILYFVMFYSRSFLFYRFILVVPAEKKPAEWTVYINTFTYLFCVALAVISPWFHSIFWFDKYGYHVGALYDCLYVALAVHIITCCYILFINFEEMNRQVQLWLWISVGFIAAGTIIRKLLPTVLVMNTFFLFAILILFLAVQNPDRYVDGRTQCFNARAFQMILRERLERKQYKTLFAFAINRYNDKREIYSSSMTDLALEEIGVFLKNEFPSAEKFYLRNGQFVLLLNNKLSAEYVHGIMKERFNNLWNIRGARIYFNISQIVIDADLMSYGYDAVQDCVYAALDTGSAESDGFGNGSLNRIEKNSFDRITRQVNVRHVLATSIQENSVEAWLQPIIDAETGKIVAAEALARIRDKKLGLIPPVEFIALAEQNGMIGVLGEQILATVCSYFADRNLYQKGVKWINVNLSPTQCLDVNLPDIITNIVDSYRIPHSCVHLEITEEAMVDEAVLKVQMDALVSNGFVFALDDYGSGFSNITRVKNLPFVNIKLDKQVVRNHFQKPDNILPATVKMFTDRGQTVTAEGVETEEMAHLLRDMGCTHLQGFYYSAPIPITEFEQLLKDN